MSPGFNPVEASFEIPAIFVPASVFTVRFSALSIALTQAVAKGESTMR